MNMAEIESTSTRRRHVRLRNEDSHVGANTTHSGDSDVYYPSDDNHGFFAKVCTPFLSNLGLMCPRGWADLLMLF